jgi:hypothetical protein
MSNISNSALITNQIPRGRFLKLPIQDTIQPPRLVHIPLDTILDMLWCISAKMVCLTLHAIFHQLLFSFHDPQSKRSRRNSRTNPRIQKEQPIGHLIKLPRAPRVTNLIILIILINQILLNASALKQPYLLPITESISESGDSAVGVNLEEPRLFLRVFGDVDFVHCVR